MTTVPGPLGALPIFAGYPYLVTHVVPALYHLIVLPGDASARDLRDLAMAQWRANRLQTCLVLARRKPRSSPTGAPRTAVPRPGAASR
jgi:hypothetical protein